MSGMTSWVTPEPTLAQPAATPLASPTTGPENMELIQNWLATKFARENPTRKRTAMNALGEETRNDMARTAGAVRRESVAEAILGPTRSHAGPIARREKMDPTKEATPAWLMSASVRLRSRRMTAVRGGMEKVEKKQAKRESHAKWKALMWGDDIDSGRKTVAFWSRSTGREKSLGL
ncbi:hypothetical protein PanWU01x14_288700, partial [Parasponia andersonii]